ncbi:MAG: hypothetical protein RL571_1069 [Pseudomonadota bacterium]
MHDEHQINKILLVSFIVSLCVNPVIGFFACAYIRFKQKNIFSCCVLIFLGVVVAFFGFKLFEIYNFELSQSVFMLNMFCTFLLKFLGQAMMRGDTEGGYVWTRGRLIVGWVFVVFMFLVIGFISIFVI